MTYYSKHCSKKDGWLVGVVAMGILFPLMLGIYLWIEEDLSRSLPTLFIGTVFIAVLVGLIYPLYYEINDSTVTIHSGLTRKKIPISAIERVSPSSDWTSAPAWSLDRLRINWEPGVVSCSTLISPEDKMKFLQDLSQVDSGLRIEGNVLIRRSAGA